MTDERTPDQPEQWDKDQMETDDPAVSGPPSVPDDQTRPDWNKGEVAEEHEDHTGGHHDEPVEAPGGLSGGGSNPGGGERWADRDKEG